MSNTIPHRVTKRSYKTHVGTLLNNINNSKYYLAYSSEDMTWDQERTVMFLNNLLEGKWPQPVRTINTSQSWRLNLVGNWKEKCILNCHYELGVLFKLSRRFLSNYCQHRSMSVIEPFSNIDFDDFRYDYGRNTIFSLRDPNRFEKPSSPKLNAKIYKITITGLLKTWYFSSRVRECAIKNESEVRLNRSLPHLHRGIFLD